MVVVSFTDAYNFGFVGLHLTPLLPASRLVESSVQLKENQ